MHINIRMAGIRYLIDHPEIFIHSLASETWESYINRMSTPGTWCDNLIIQAVANALNCVIHTLFLQKFVHNLNPLSLRLHWRVGVTLI